LKEEELNNPRLNFKKNVKSIAKGETVYDKISKVGPGKLILIAKKN